MKYILAIIFSCFGLTTFAQEQFPQFEKKEFIRNNDTLRYRIMFPVDFNAKKKYPVLLFLHGSGERGGDNEAQLVHGGKLFADSAGSYPAIVIFPQCPAEEKWVGYQYNDNEPDPKKRMQLLPDATIQKPLELVKLLLDSIRNTKTADKKRFYIGGLSMGGFGTFDMLQRYPTYFAAAFPICGGGLPADAAKYAKHLPLWIFHGAADSVVNPDWSRDMVAALKNAGANVKYSEYPGVNHNSWDNAFAEPELFSWLFAQKK